MSLALLTGCMAVDENHDSAPSSSASDIIDEEAFVSPIYEALPEDEKLLYEMVKEAVEAGADIIMLDNMDKETMKEAIRIIDGRAKTECSGNVTKENVANLIDIGVDYISSGALTHSAPIMDLSLKNLHAVE